MTEDIQQTLVLIKPDGVQRGLVGEIITRLEARGLRIAAMKMQQLDVETASHVTTAYTASDHSLRGWSTL